MKPIIMSKSKAVILLFMLLTQIGLNAQTFQFTIENQALISANIIEFDLLLINLDPGTPLEIATVQAGVVINPATYGGGSITAQIVPGRSTMNPAQVPTSVSFNQSENCVKLAAKAPPGCGAGTIMSTNPSAKTILTTIRLGNTQPWDFSLACLNSTFVFTNPPYPTKLSWYDPTDCIHVILPVSSANCFTVGNICGEPPTAYAVTGGGAYCQGGIGLPVGLSNSQAGVTYTLYKNSIPQMPTISGTGSPISFGNQLAGTYTVGGTAQSGTTTMTGNALINELNDKVLSAKIFLEGLFAGPGIMNQAFNDIGPHYGSNIADKILIKIAEGTFPYSVIYSDSVFVRQNGQCNMTLPCPISGSYYIVVNHRNSIATWSKYPVSFTSDSIHYDFSESITAAYNDNLKYLAGLFWIFAGDVNQDGIDDSGDMILVDNQSSQFTTGYVQEDVNGDGLVDATDMILIGNNADNFVSSYYPTSSLLEVTTNGSTNITQSSAQCLGEVNSQGSTAVTAKGICWNTTPNPNITGDHTINGTGAGTFTAELTGLSPFTTYYFKAYATNGSGVSYGSQRSFKTLATFPTISTDSITEITGISATTGGFISSDGGSPILSRGVCWDTLANPSLSRNYTTDGTGTGNYNSYLTNLSPFTLYYVRAYATNGVGTAYGNEIVFSTLTSPPTVITDSISNITDSTATCGGHVTNDGGSTVTLRGVCWSSSPDPTIVNDSTVDGSGTGIYDSQITDLLPNTTYYVRAYANNASGTAYGNQVAFVTPVVVPKLISSALTDITGTSATCGGTITEDGGSAIITKGVCWSTSPNPTITNNHTLDGTGMGSFNSSISGLLPKTTYYVRAYASNSQFTGYGNEYSFSTLYFVPGNPVNDIDSNLYTTIVLGESIWTIENLRTTRFSNGDTLPNVTSNGEWAALTTAAWSWYSNNETMEIPFGKLYNWYAVADLRNVCPSGWRVPSDADWTELTDYLGGLSIAGGMMKEEGTTHWNTPNTGATNTSGFTGIAGGNRTTTGTFGSMGTYGIWWSSTESSSSVAWYRSLYYNNSNAARLGNNKKYGFSVRCLRDVGSVQVTTGTVDNISETTAASGGLISDDGGVPITARGVCWSTNQNPTLSDSHTLDGSGTGSFTSIITGLSPGTTYYVRAYSTNSMETTYGNEVITLAGTVTDIDGNVYSIIKIGTQTWMAENLEVTHYRNGTNIQYPGSSSSGWQNNTAGAYAWINNDIFWKDVYGALYNWHAVNNSNGLCPSGWHVPSDAEFTQLTSFISGGTTNGGDQLKSCRQVSSPLGGECNTNVHPRWNYSIYAYGTDEYGFSALPGGSRATDGQFYTLGYGLWWSCTAYNPTTAWRRSMNYSTSSVYTGYVEKANGYSVRCVRDN